MNKCILCKKETLGSVGAAGIHWTRICQSCKDKEDKALLESLKQQRNIFENLFNDIMVDKETN